MCPIRQGLPSLVEWGPHVRTLTIENGAFAPAPMPAIGLPALTGELPQ